MPIGIFVRNYVVSTNSAELYLDVYYLCGDKLGPVGSMKSTTSLLSPNFRICTFSRNDHPYYNYHFMKTQVLFYWR